MADFDSVTAFAQTKIDDFSTIVEGAQTSLGDIVNGALASFTFGTLTEFEQTTQMVNYTPANVTMDTVSPYSAPDAPTLSNRDAPAVATLTPLNLTAANAALVGFNPASFNPDEIDGEITGLATKILAWIDSGGPGVSEAVQTALWNNNRARRQQSLDDMLLKVRQANSMSGWPRSNSLTEASENELLLKFQTDDENLNYQITALMTERAQQTAVAAMNAGVSLTGIKSGFQKDIYSLYYTLQALVLDEFKTLVGAAETEFEGGLKKILGDYDIWKASKEGDKIAADVFGALAQGEAVRVRSETELATAKADVGLKSNNLLLNAATAETSSQLEKWKDTIQILYNRGAANIDQLKAVNAHRLEAARLQADFYKGATVGVTQMVNALLNKKV